MSRTLTAAIALALLSAFSVTPALAQTAPAKTAKKAPARKKAAAAEPVSATNDNLSPGQLAEADHVLTGIAQCESREKVDIEKVEGHNGNFKLTFDRHSYVMVPEETTTGAVRLVDTGGAVVWVQIPSKSMLMNQKLHQRLVDDCEEPAQRDIATGAAAPAAGVETTTTAPAAPVKTTTTTSTTTTTKVVPGAAVPRAAAPDAAASGMWK